MRLTWETAVDIAAKYAEGTTHRMSVDFEVKAVDGPTGELKGYGAVFGNRDRGGDIIEPGAFTESLAQLNASGMVPNMFLGHDPDRPVGDWLTVREDAKGLWVEGELWIPGGKACEDRGRFPTEDAKAAWNMMSNRSTRGLSIGYTVAKGGAYYDEEKNAVVLKKLDLLEISPVGIPMNPLATPTSVKSTHIPCERDLEHALKRSCGLTNAQAKRLLSGGYSSLLRDEPAEKATDTMRDDGAELKAALDNLLMQVKGTP